jgi:5,10-methylene-tetrahydrofolate dehydrogenase/methenyl tetrahydrofolate cyclohydrolase
MESKKVLEVVVSGAVTGFSIALGWMAANKLMSAIGGKKTVVVGTSEVIGGGVKQMCKDMSGKTYPCGSQRVS